MERRLDEMAEAISGARRALEAGGMLDMAPLKRLATAAADESAHVGAADAARLQPRLLALLADLNALAGEMRDAHAALRGKLGGAGTRQRAVTAYGRPTDR